jgi:predicted esterase
MRIPRTARYWTEGDTAAARDVWVILHGYGQLAADFLRAAGALAGPGRLVVAPEALSRFYAKAPEGGSHTDAGVGASWMTREDRDHEIDDYVGYLDALLSRVMAPQDPAPGVHVLGFSQGVATAARWVAAGEVRPATLVLWGSLPPADLDEAGRRRFVGLDLRLVHGTNDRLVTPDALEATVSRLRLEGARVTIRTFEGGHRLDHGVLAELAGSVRCATGGAARPA